MTQIENGERTLVTTLTKRMAEELNNYLVKLDIKTVYIHSDVKPMDRIKIIDQLRSGEIDVLVGVNLLREGLDLPEVSLVAILDADKEGFLRSHRSLTQTVGRAARNLNGRVIMFADHVTDSMRQTIEETERRRSIQMKYNEEHNITPQAIVKARHAIIGQEDEAPEPTAYSPGTPAVSGSKPKERGRVSSYAPEQSTELIAADPVMAYMSIDELKNQVNRLRAEMTDAAKEMRFIEAARLRDEIIQIELCIEKLNQ